MYRCPVHEPTYVVLAALLEGPLYGYAIVKTAEELSGGQVKLTAGTLYGALNRLCQEGLVAEDHEEVVDGRKRRYYRLTETGVEALTSEADRLALLADAVRARLRPKSPSVAWS